MKVKTSIIIEQELLRKLKKYCIDKGTTMSALITGLVESEVKK